MHFPTLQRAELADSDRETPDGETKDHDSDTRTDPCQERAFVGEVVASSVGVVRHAGGSAGRLFHSFLDQGRRPRKILKKVAWEAVAALQILGAVVGDPDLALIILPDQGFQGKIDG